MPRIIAEKTLEFLTVLVQSILCWKFLPTFCYQLLGGTLKAPNKPDGEWRPIAVRNTFRGIFSKGVFKNNSFTGLFFHPLQLVISERSDYDCDLLPVRYILNQSNHQNENLIFFEIDLEIVFDPLDRSDIQKFVGDMFWTFQSDQ